MRMKTTHIFIMKIPNKGEIWHIATIHSPNIDFDEFKKTYTNILLQSHIHF